MEEIEFKDILKIGDEKMEDLVEGWNNVLAELNKPEKFESTHDVAKKIKETVSTQIKRVNVETLKKHIKAWVEPTFMQHKENLEEEKKMVQGTGCFQKINFFLAFLFILCVM